MRTFGWFLALALLVGCSSALVADAPDAEDPIPTAEVVAASDPNPAVEQCLVADPAVPAFLNVLDVTRCLEPLLGEAERQCTQMETDRLTSEWVAPELDPALPDISVGLQGPIGLMTNEQFETVGTVPSVSRASPQVVSLEQHFLLDGAGQPVRAPDGSPGVFADWGAVLGSTLSEGRAPSGPGEIAATTTAVRVGSLVVGQTYELASPAGNETVTLVGVFDADETAGVSLAMTLEEAARVVHGRSGYSGIAVWVEPGADMDLVANAIQVALEPTGFTGTAVVVSAVPAEFAEMQAAVQGQLAMLLCIDEGQRIAFVSELAGEQVSAASAECLLVGIADTLIELAELSTCR